MSGAFRPAVHREAEARQEHLSRLSADSRRSYESVDFGTELYWVLNSALSLTTAYYGVMTLLDNAGKSASANPSQCGMQ